MSGTGGVGLYFDRQGKPIEMMDWAALHDDTAYRIIAQHWIRGWMVSTVWLGLDHGYGYLTGRTGAPPPSSSRR
jgi:hypothetical protein